MISSYILITLLAELSLIGAHFTRLDFSPTILLEDVFRENITVDYSLNSCTNISFYAELNDIASVFKTGSYKQHGQLYCEIQVHGKALGGTTIWGNISCSENCTSITEPIFHITVEESYLLALIGTFCGWIYFTAWTISFYPQIYVNWKRKSVIGFNFDFVTLNLLGYVCYSLYNIGLYYVPAIEAEYFEKFPGSTNPVQLNDVVFSVHGFFGTLYMIVQVFMYERGGQTMSKIGIILLSSLLVILAIIITGGILHIVSFLECLYYCSYIKLAVTVTKYIPQVMMNYRLKSTSGWSIGAVFCDSVGSVFSVLQMLILSYNRNDWVSILGDPTKFGLGLFSACFDVIFLSQFYLYRIMETNSKSIPRPGIKNQEYSLNVM